MIGFPPDKEYMYFTTFKRPDQVLYFLDSWPTNHGVLEKFRDKLEASEFSDSEFNEYAVEFWGGEVSISEFVDWLEDDIFNNTIFDELKKRREQHEKGNNNKQDSNNEGNEDNQVSGNAESGQDGDA